MSIKTLLHAGVDPILLKFVQGYRNPSFIYDRVVPVIPVLTESGTILSEGKEGFKLFNTRRDIGNPIPQAIPELPGSSTYQLEEESILRNIDVREMKIAETYGLKQVYDLKKKRLAICKNNTEMVKEKAVADIVFGASYYASGNKVTLTGGDQFSDYSNSDPIGVFEAGKVAARADMGVEPNILVIGYLAWQKLKWHPQLTEKLAVTGHKILTEEMVASLLGFDEVIVGKNSYSSDAGVFVDLWGDFAALLYRPAPSEFVEGTTVHTAVLQQEGFPIPKEWPQEKVLLPVSNRDMFTVKNINTSNGYLITDLIA